MFVRVKTPLNAFSIGNVHEKKPLDEKRYILFQFSNKQISVLAVFDSLNLYDRSVFDADPHTSAY